MLRSYDAYCRKVAAPPEDRGPWHGSPSVPLDESEFFKALFDGMRCGILSIDRQGRLVVLNELALQILSLDSCPPVGTPVSVALRHMSPLLDVLERCFDMRHLPNREEMVLTTADGKKKTIGYTLSLIRATPDTEPVGAAVFFKDLTIIEQKEEQERLKDRLAALGQMAASLAHEIRNPLASIDVTCSLLRRRSEIAPADRKLLDKITAEVRRLNRTITSSLEFVRPVSLNRSMTGIHKLLEEAIDVAVDRCRGKSIVVERQLEPTVGEFLIDRAQMRQVFENLLINAFEACDNGGVVRVSAEVIAADAATPTQRPPTLTEDPASAFCEIRVADSGPGIPEDEHDKVFYPFFTTKEHGSGVGLSMAKKIVDSHRGSIDLLPNTGRGAEFSVCLPMLTGSVED